MCMIDFEKRTKDILKLRRQRFTLAEIGKKYSLTRERVRQIEVVNLKRTTYKSGEPLKLTWEKLKRTKAVEELKILNKRKRKFLGLPINIIYISGGGRNFVREMIRIRDKQTCQRCKKKWKEGKRKFDVHHLDEKMLGKTLSKGVIRYDKTNMDKLITFCHKCHYAWHKDAGHTKSWYKGKK